MDHCCRRRHYFFEIKKCGKDGCEICKPTRLSQEIFEQIKPFPDQEPGDDDYYNFFLQIYERTTSEKFRPSFNDKPINTAISWKVAACADLMLECEKCAMWRLVYAKQMLIPSEHKSLEDALNGASFFCGSPLLQDLDLPAELEKSLCEC